MRKLITEDVTPEQRAVYDALATIIGKHSAYVDPDEMVAMFAQMIGGILAITDGDIDDPDIRRLISRNIEDGYRQSREHLFGGDVKGHA